MRRSWASRRPAGERWWFAAVIPAEGHAVDEHALREHCYARVTRYKVPRRIVAVDDLPRSMLGKILRRKVREQLLNSEEFSH